MGATKSSAKKIKAIPKSKKIPKKTNIIVKKTKISAKFKKEIKPDFSEISLTNIWQDTIFLQNNSEYPFQNVNKSITINPAVHKMDGFFISIFQRKR